MKKHTATLILLLAACCLMACAPERHIYKIGVAQCSKGRWRNKVNREMLAAQHLYEHDVKVSIAQSYDDTQLQIRQIDSLANAGIDLLVVAPNETEPITQAIARVRAKGIPVIFFDRKADIQDYTAFIGADNVEAGATMANYACSLNPHRILEITGNISSSPAQERHKGFASVIAAHPDIEYTLSYGDWTANQTYRILKLQIAAGLVPDLVFCHNDGMAQGAFKAVKETNNIGKIHILGIDGMPDEGIKYVQQHQQTATYIYPTHGEKIVKLALDILTHRKYQRENTLQGSVVTPENANIVARNAMELISQNEDLITIHDKLEQYLGLYNSQRKALFASFALCVLLIVAVVAIWRAYRQTRKATRQRQALNEEQTVFYTKAAPQPQRTLFEIPHDELPKPRSQDEIFAQQLNQAIRDNMGNPALKMDDLGETVGLSRVQLYRKVKSITGLTPVELLKQMRLQQAYILLCNTNKTVQEIAYQVGFATPGYFSKCFRQQYGKYPMELRNGEK